MGPAPNQPTNRCALYAQLDAEGDQQQAIIARAASAVAASWRCKP